MIEDDEHQNTDHEKYLERELYCRLRPLAFNSNYLFGERLCRAEAFTIARKLAYVFGIAPLVLNLSVSQWRMERMRYRNEHRDTYNQYRQFAIRSRDKSSEESIFDVPEDPTLKLIKENRHPVWRSNDPQRSTAISLSGVNAERLQMLNKCWDGEVFSSLDVFLEWIEPHLQGVDIERGQASKFWDAGPLDDILDHRELTVREEEFLSDLGADLDDYR